MEMDLDARHRAGDDLQQFSASVASDTSANAAGTAAESQTTCTETR
jgi:hypothetical protein